MTGHLNRSLFKILKLLIKSEFPSLSSNFLVIIPTVSLNLFDGVLTSFPRPFSVLPIQKRKSRLKRTVYKISNRKIVN